MDENVLKNAIKKFSDANILVVGDIMLDKYTNGDAKRTSAEAIVPVFNEQNQWFVPGGAANVANNIVSLGARVFLAGVIGKDYYGRKLRKILVGKKISTEFVFEDDSRPTIVKHRLLSQNRQVLRIDTETTENLKTDLEELVFESLQKIITEIDLVVLSDYDKGLFSETLARKIIQLAKKFDKKIIADIKPKNKDYFIGVDVVTPNLEEAVRITGLKKIENIGNDLVGVCKSDVLITRGKDGISVFIKDGRHIDISGEKVATIDVSGAGDTVVALIGLSMASGLNLEQSAYLANLGASVVVQKLGTATLTREEILSSLEKKDHIDDITKTQKVWGYEKWLENNERYCCKLLSLDKNFQCSLHYHKIKDEMFLVTKGYVRLELEEKIHYLREGNFIRILPGQVHRFRGIEDSIIMEISSHHEDSDSYRIEESRRVDNGN